MIAGDFHQPNRKFSFRIHCKERGVLQPLSFMKHWQWHQDEDVDKNVFLPLKPVRLQPSLARG